MADALVRTDAWLQERVHDLQRRYFADVVGGHPIVARFGRRAVRRWGTIREDHGKAVIAINSLFRFPEVPEVVLDGTIVHELAHYAHGFGSGLPRRVAQPHAGGVVRAELQRRGCLHLERQADGWLLMHWPALCDRYAADLVAVRQRKPNPVWQKVLASNGWRTEADLQALAARTAAAFRLLTYPYPVGWLHATRRQTGMSYRRRSDGMVRLHGLLASPEVPESVLVCEMGLWIVASDGRCVVTELEEAFRNAGLGRAWEEAARFRAKTWPRICRAHHAFWR